MRKGFTLIELLVVVLIMGILASVAMPQYFKSVEKSRAAEGIGAINAIYSAQERHYMQKGTFASKLSDLDVGISNLTYFTVTHVNAGGAEGSGNKIVQVKRLTEAGGGLGQYIILFRFPAELGSRAGEWDCSPISSGCRSFLPK